jgi:hypothetical protein
MSAFRGLREPLLKKASEESQLTFVRESSVNVSHNPTLQPVESMRGSLLVEMSRNSGNMKL